MVPECSVGFSVVVTSKCVDLLCWLTNLLHLAIRSLEQLMETSWAEMFHRIALCGKGNFRTHVGKVGQQKLGELLLELGNGRHRGGAAR